MNHVKFLICSLIVMSFMACNKNASVKNTGKDSSYANHPRANTYQKIIDDYQQNTSAPGCVMLVARSGEPLWIGANGLAEISNNRSMTVNTLFRVGSLTKVYVAAYILSLIEQGKLGLDDKFSDLVPEIAAKIPGSHKIAVRHLLAHLSGVVDPSNESEIYKSDLINDPVSFRHLSIERLLDTYVRAKDLHFDPGTAFQYSNTGYWLLQLIAERKGGKDLSVLLKERFFAPLGLKHTRLDKDYPDSTAAGYAVIEGNEIMDVTIYDRADSDGRASGGIVSTAKEIYTFMDALFSGKLITTTMLAEMKKVQLPGCNTEDCKYGLGLEQWTVKALNGWGHNGSSVGYEANAIYFDQSKTLVVLFKNLGGGSDKSFLYDLAK